MADRTNRAYYKDRLLVGDAKTGRVHQLYEFIDPGYAELAPALGKQLTPLGVIPEHWPSRP